MFLDLRPRRACTAARAGGFGLALLLAGCASGPAARPFDSTAHLRNQIGARLGAERAAGIALPFELDDRLRQVIDERVSPAGSERRRVNAILDFIFRDLDLAYDLTPTRDAAGTFAARRGNCLSFVNLFVAIARERRLSPFFVEVTDQRRWSYRDGTVVSQGHIVAGMYLAGELTTFDFLPYEPKAYRDFQPIDDLTAVAHFYNNLGAEALLAGDLERARGLLEVAVGVAPGFTKAVNNLGVCLARLGETEEAVELYRRGLETDPGDAALITNLARAYQTTGQTAEAEELLTRIEELDLVNPFFYVYKGEAALAAGEPEKALEHLARALRIDTEVPEVHVALAKTYLALGELRRARHHIGRALKLDATHEEARRLAGMIERP